MSLYRYVQNFEAIAHELAKLAPAADRRKMARQLKQHGLDAVFDHYNRANADLALRFLGATPARQRDLWQKLQPEERQPILFLALFLALQSAGEARAAEVYQDMIGLPYRKALRNVAAQRLQDREPPAEDRLMELLSSAL